jgi:hypothetical protein
VKHLNNQRETKDSKKHITEDLKILIVLKQHPWNPVTGIIHHKTSNAPSFWKFHSSFVLIL